MERPDIGPWSVVKNEILQEYAKSYLTIMLNQEWCKGVLYIDAFAGATENLDRSTSTPVPGSAKRALDLNPGFSEYYFFDLDNKRIQDLLALTEGRADVTVALGDGNTLTQEIVVPLLQYDNYRRGLVFLDPYGLDLDWETVQLLGHTRSADVVINFPIMDINRNSVRRVEADIPDGGAARMTRLWGGEEWRDEFYGLHPNLSMWGDQPKIKTVTSDEIANSYRNRLLTKGGYTHATTPLLMRNKQNAPLYYILMASNNSTAVDIMNSIQNKYKKQMTPQSLPLWIDE